MPKKTGSTLDELAAINAADELRAAEAELLSRKAAADNAIKDQELAAARVAEEALKLNPPAPVAVPVVKIPSWQPAETLSGEAVRLKVAVFGRAILDHVESLRGIGVQTIGWVGPILATFEQGELGALLTALEKGAGLKAAPRHTDDCLKLRAVMTSMAMPVVCIATCPMVGYKPPTSAAGTASTPRASSSTVGTGIGHSAGKVSFVGPDGTREDDLDCSQAARKAAAAYPTAERCIAWVANRDANGAQGSARLPLHGDIARGNVPQGTFGETVTTKVATPDGAPYPFTPAAAAAA